MAFKKRTRTGRRKTRKVSRRRRIPRGVTAVVPASRVVSMRYVDTISIDPSTSVAGSHVYRANSVWDPDYTITGHQPYGFDEISPFYDHYTVLGSKITARFISLATTPSSGTAHVGILLKDNVTVVSNPTLVMEATGSRYRLMTNAGASQASPNVSCYYSPKRFFGIKDINDNRGLLGSATTGNPTEDAYFHVWATPIDASYNVAAMNVLITIEYTVKFTERKVFASS